MNKELSTEVINDLHEENERLLKLIREKEYEIEQRNDALFGVSEFLEKAYRAAQNIEDMNHLYKKCGKEYEPINRRGLLIDVRIVKDYIDMAWDTAESVKEA